ncbi:MAG: hypothetical protein ICV60_19280, partial [Pyrinomonadaceae bacterium]|nr:hypothetical protein [Pyrinomonadaceae bacterium]
MGRVYDALKRAAETNGKRKEDEPQRNTQNGNGNRLPSTIAAHPWDRSSLFAVPSAANSSTFSASTAHTETIVGSALPGELASRAAGATLGAAGSTRALECVSLD